MKKFTNTKQQSYAKSRRRRSRLAEQNRQIFKIKIKKGDTVKVMTGKDKGKTGEVTEVLRTVNKVVIDGVAVAKRSIRKSGRGQSGRIVERAMPINVSNVMLVDPSSKKPTRIGRRTEGEKNVRYAKKSSTTLK